MDGNPEFCLYSIQIDSVRLAVNIAIGTENMMADWGPVAVEKIQNDAKGKLLR